MIVHISESGGRRVLDPNGGVVCGEAASPGHWEAEVGVDCPEIRRHCPLSPPCDSSLMKTMVHTLSALTPDIG